MSPRMESALASAAAALATMAVIGAIAGLILVAATSPRLVVLAVSVIGLWFAIAIIVWLVWGPTRRAVLRALRHQGREDETDGPV